MEQDLQLGSAWTTAHAVVQPPTRHTTPPPPRSGARAPTRPESLPVSQCHPIPTALVLTGATSPKAAATVPASRDALAANEAPGAGQPPRSLHPGVLPQTAPGHRPLRTQNSAGRPADNGRRRARSKLSTEEVFCLHSPAPDTGHLVWVPHTQHAQNQILRVPHSTDRPGAWPLCTWPSHAAQPRGTLLSVLCPPRLALSPNASVHTAPSPGNTPSPPRHPANSTSFRRSGLRHRLFRRAFQNPQHYPRPRGCPHVHRSLP